jgi:hypothetical protein
MQQMFIQLLRFLQQGIAAIFRFVQLIWSWSTGDLVDEFRRPHAGHGSASASGNDD